MRATVQIRSLPNRPTIGVSFFASFCVPSYSHILSLMEQIEVEIKFRVKNPISFETQLDKPGFKKTTPRTFERNTLYDTPGRDLLNSGRLLRLRQYGERWVMTFKAKPEDDYPDAAHKSRLEIETGVENGIAA